jgi:hypothetical protein
VATARIHPLFAPRALAVAGVAAAALLAAPAGAQKGGGGGGDTPASLGPLAPHVALSPAGRPWIATVGTDGALLVENTTDPAGITLHRMPSAGARPTSVSVRVVVAAATAEPPPPGLRSGAGLLYGVQGSGPEVFFYALLVEPDGTVSLLRRSAAEGVQPVLSQRIAGGGGEARQAELRIVETAAGGAEFHLDGRRFATLRSQGIGEGSVGVVAFGVGRYAFRDFRLGPAKPLGAPAGPAAPDATTAKPPPAGAPAGPGGGRGAEAAPPAGGGASPAAAARLVPHRDPAGFALDRPEGWTVEAPAPTQVAVWDPSGRTGALIRGRAARGELT